MRIARIIGSAVSTIKAESLRGTKLLVVQPASLDDQLLDEPPFVAIDAVGAGEGELVLIGEGSAGRHTSLTRDAPVDAVILAILDSLEVGGETRFRKS